MDFYPTIRSTYLFLSISFSTLIIIRIVTFLGFTETAHWSCNWLLLIATGGSCCLCGFVFVRVCACLCICVRAFLFVLIVCVFVCLFLSVCVFVCVFLCVCVCVFLFVFIVYVCLCVYLCPCVLLTPGVTQVVDVYLLTVCGTRSSLTFKLNCFLTCPIPQHYKGGLLCIGLFKIQCIINNHRPIDL